MTKVAQTNVKRSSTALSIRDVIRLFFQGVAIGAANVIPGVSGGTLALIFGFYEKLIDSIKMLGRGPFWRSTLGLNWVRSFKLVNGGFLLTLVLGAVVAILTLARGLEWLYVNEPIYILSFFFGLILASILPVSRYIYEWTPNVIATLIIGAVLGYFFVGLTPTSLPTSWPFLFLSGALAATAFILPGISGAFILVLLGNYEYILGIVNRREWLEIGILGVGAVLGLISLAQLLGWLFRRFRNATLALLAGFMLGSLRKIWPWKLGGLDDTDIVQNVLPQVLTNGQINTEVFVGAALIAVGIGVIIFIDWLMRVQER